MKFQSMRFISVLLCLTLTIGLSPLTVQASLETATQQPSNAAAALQQGRRLLKRGNADQALVQLQTALDLYSTANNRRGIAAAHNELGDLYFRQGQSKTALDHYQKAFDALTGALSQEQRNTAVASSAASRVGDSRAGQLTETAASVSDTGFNAQLILAKIGDTNFRLGQMSDAAASYSRMNPKKPESAAKKAGGLFGKIAPSIAIGNATDSAALGSAAGAIGGALAAKNELDQYRTSIVYMTYHLGMGRIAFARNDLEGARKHFQEAADAGKGALPMIANLGQTRRFNAAARTSLGDVSLRQGNFKQANGYYKDAVKEAKDDKRPDLMWPAQRGLGRTQWLQAAQEKDSKKAMQAREAALVSYREALQNIETLRAGSLRADESRTTFLSTTKDVFDEAASALARMALLSSAPGNASAGLSGKALEYAAEGFKVTEQSRARSLLDLLSETNASITEGVPADLLKQRQENLEEQQQIAEQLTGIALTPDEPKKKPGELESDLEKLQVKFDEIENQIRVASPNYRALTSNQPLTLAEVQQKVLDDQTVLLECSLGAEASYLWAINSKEVRLYELPGKATLDKLVEDLRAQLIPSKLRRRIVGLEAGDSARGLGVASASEDAAPLVAAANALYKAAVEPAAALIGEKRLLIVADGALSYVPFEALVTSAAGGDFSSLPYLIKTNEIVYSPSASVVGAIREQRRRSAGSGLLIIADPVFNSIDPRARGAAVSTTAADTRGLGLASALADVEGQAAVATAETAKMQGLPLARLPGTRAEAEQISALAKKAGLPTDVWWDLNANEENVETRDVSKYRVLHIATHGLLNVERPQFTGVVLSLIGNKSADGFLRTDEVFNLRLGSPLVMLSACETGIGKQKRGEGVMGLTRAFLYAGAPTVGVSLWSVADKSTAELMTDFYKRLLTPASGASGSADSSPAAAMRGAQLAMISSKKYSAPFYWAPFVLVGDWR